MRPLERWCRFFCRAHQAGGCGLLCDCVMRAESQRGCKGTALQRRCELLGSGINAGKLWLHTDKSTVQVHNRVHWTRIEDPAERRQSNLLAEREHFGRKITLSAHLFARSVERTVFVFVSHCVCKERRFWELQIISSQLCLVCIWERILRLNAFALDLKRHWKSVETSLKTGEKRDYRKWATEKFSCSFLCQKVWKKCTFRF